MKGGDREDRDTKRRAGRAHTEAPAARADCGVGQPMGARGAYHPRRKAGWREKGRTKSRRSGVGRAEGCTKSWRALGAERERWAGEAARVAWEIKLVSLINTRGVVLPACDNLGALTEAASG